MLSPQSPYSVTLQALLKQTKIDAPLGVRFKNESPRIPALRHVMGESCRYDASESCHCPSS